MIEAIKALTEEDLIRIHAAARFITRIYRRQEPEELVNEAVVRAAEGVRNWPVDLPFLTFLKGIMRSLASHAAEAEASTERLESDEQTAGPLERQEPATGLAVAREVVSSEDEERLKRLRENFRDDEHVVVILDGIASGMPRQEILECGMSANDYDAAMKRIARYVDTLP